MRDLKADLIWLTEEQNKKDLSDEFLKKMRKETREFYANHACDFGYGITFVESTIAKEWLERAIKAEGVITTTE